MKPTTSRLRLVLVTLALVCAFALTGVIQQGGVPRGVSTGFVHGRPITALRIGGKMHPDDITIGFVSRKAGKGPLEY